MDAGTSRWLQGRPTARNLLAFLSVLAVSVACCHGAGLHHQPGLYDRPILFVEEVSDVAHLSSDDLKQYLINIFSSLDSGLDAQGEFAGGAGDGSLTRGELAIRITRVEKDRQYFDAMQHMEKLDKDGDGLLTWEEVEPVANKMGPVGTILARFVQADENKDTWLSEAEVSAFFHPDTWPRMFAFLSKELLLLLDKNEDDFLSISEVAPAALAQSPLKDYDYHVDFDLIFQRFSDLDSDKDGLLSLEDIATFFVDQDSHHIEEIVTEIFETADDNQDDALQLDEVVPHFRLFVGDESAFEAERQRLRQERENGVRHGEQAAEPLRGQGHHSPQSQPAHEEL